MKKIKKLLVSTLGIGLVAFGATSPIFIQVENTTTQKETFTPKQTNLSNENLNDNDLLKGRNIDFENSNFWMPENTSSTISFIDHNGDKKTDEVWGWGYYAYLGIGSDFEEYEFIEEPIRLDIIWNLPGQIIDFYTTKAGALGGDEASFIFLDTNSDDEYDEIWGWGTNNRGNLGNNSVLNEFLPIRLDLIWNLPGKIINFFTTGSHSVAFLDTNNDNEYDEIWGWGQGHLLGVGTIPGNIFFSSPLRLDEIWNFTGKIISFYSMHGSIVFIDTNNDDEYDQVWGWGSSLVLGVGNNNQSNFYLEPIRIDLIWNLPGKINHLFFDLSNSFIFLDIDDNNEYDQVWGWGSNSEGQLGIGDSTTIYYPTRLDTTWNLPGKIINFSNYWLSIFAFIDHNDDGEYDQIWGWGNNNSGQLGNGTENNIFTYPTRLDIIWNLPGEIKYFIPSYQCLFVFINTDDNNYFNKTFAWGVSLHLGIGDIGKILSPLEIQNIWAQYVFYGKEKLLNLSSSNITPNSVEVNFDFSYEITSNGMYIPGLDYDIQPSNSTFKYVDLENGLYQEFDFQTALSQSILIDQLNPNTNYKISFYVNDVLQEQPLIINTLPDILESDIFIDEGKIYVDQDIVLVPYEFIKNQGTGIIEYRYAKVGDQMPDTWTYQTTHNGDANSHIMLFDLEYNSNYEIQVTANGGRAWTSATFYTYQISTIEFTQETYTTRNVSISYLELNLGPAQSADIYYRVFQEGEELTTPWAFFATYSSNRTFEIMKTGLNANTKYTIEVKIQGQDSFITQYFITKL